MLENNKLLISDVTLWFYIPLLSLRFVIRGKNAAHKMFVGSANSKIKEREKTKLDMAFCIISRVKI